MYVVGMHINACVSGQHIGCMCIVNTCRAPVRFYRSAVCAPSVVQPLTRHIVPEKGGSESTAAAGGRWQEALEREVAAALTEGRPDVMADFAADFEKTVYRAALDFTHGRKVEAAVKLGVGRNTITRKIQELGLE